MKVVIDGDEAEEATVDPGIPQGTVLGPLLFLCHINDLPDSVRSSVSLLADDCLLYRNISTHNPSRRSTKTRSMGQGLGNALQREEMLHT